MNNEDDLLTKESLIKELFEKKHQVDKKRKSFDLPKSMCTKIDKVSKQRGITKSRFAEIAFEMLFDFIEKAEVKEEKK
jgi:hypothetical protein